MSAREPVLPWATRAAMLVRLLGIQSAWNYETMLGNGIAFAMEPALLTPGVLARGTHDLLGCLGPVEVAVEAGLSDGKSTEISAEGLRVGDQILLEIEEGVS